jgi:hypothetical protein
VEEGLFLSDFDEILDEIARRNLRVMKVTPTIQK